MSDARGIGADWRFRPLGAQQAELGESPFVSGDGLHIWWVDTTGQRLLRSHLQTEEDCSWPMPEQIGFVVEAWGQCILGMERGLIRFDPRDGSVSGIADTSPGQGMRYNDACVDAWGGLWAGTMAMDGEAPTGVLYHWPRPDQRQRVADGFRRINGLAHDKGRARMLLSDSHPDVRTIWTMDLASSVLPMSCVQMIRLDDEQGRPDGAFVDRAGCYWVATLEGGSLLGFSGGAPVPSLHIKLPVQAPTKAALGSDGRLYITSKQSDQDPLGGRLLVGEAHDTPA